MKRVLLKLSGEALAGEKKTGFDEATVIEVAKQIREISKEGLEIGIVIGGGNFWRGRTSETIDRNKADQIGMLATVMNCIYVSDICRYLGMKTQIYTPFVCGAFTNLYSKALLHCIFGIQMQWRRALHRVRSYSLQAEQDIRISPQIQQQFFVQWRLRQRRFFWQRQ